MKLNYLNSFILISGLFFFFTVTDVFADVTSVTSNNIYTVEVPIATNSLPDRNKAFTDALKKVLLQLTQNQAVITTPIVKSKLNKAEIFVRSYSYLHKANVGQQDLFLVVVFDPKGLEQLLSQAHIKAQPQESINTEKTQTLNKESLKSANENHQEQHYGLSEGKADVLVWLTILGTLPKDNTVISDSSNSELAISFKSNAKHAGLNVLLPVMDLEELSQVTGDDICNLNTEVIKKSSQRYNGDAILIGCINKNLVGKKGQWLLLANKKQYAWIFYGATDDDVLQQVISSTSKILITNVSKQSNPEDESKAVVPIQGPVEKVVLKIEGVSNLEQYNQVIKYLKSIAPISDVELLNLSSSFVQLRLDVAGGEEALTSALEAPEQNKLVPDDVGNDANILSYRLVEYAP